MKRRKFLLDASRGALGFGAFWVQACSSRTPNIENDAFLQSLVSAWETGIPQWLHETKMPAVSIAIVRSGRLAWRRAFGVKDTDNGEAVDVNSVFAACSDTKPVFAYGVVKLWEKGVLDLDAPLTKYTARRVTSDPRVELITARHVLNHTTGFPNWRQGKDLPIEFTPGSRNQYSGEGFSYLQSVVEEITGKSFVDFMHDDVLKPLGMTSSRVGFNFATDHDYAKQVARRHDENGKRIPDNPVTPERHAEDLARYGAAAALMTTPSDYATFLLEYLDPKPGDAYRPSQAKRAEMLRPQIKKTDNTWEGLAWHLEQFEGLPLLFSHAGQDAGYYCLCGASAERRSGLMVMLNGDAYVPFLLKMLANPALPELGPDKLWPDFAKRFFAA